MKKKNKILNVLLCAALIGLTAIGMSPLSSYAADYNTAAESPVWQHSKSKTATNLDKDYTSEITLSLPSGEEQLTTEVCFVLDKSSFSDTQEPAMKLLSELKDAVSTSGAKVQVDIVEFNRTAHDHGSYDLATQYDEIEAAFEKQNSGGTNMHAGLLLAQEILARNTSIPDSRKYMILVSDGDSYLYCKNGDYTKAYSRSFISVESGGAATAYGGYYDESWYAPSAGYEDPQSGKKNVKRPATSSQSDWEAYLNDVAARNQESSGDSYDFEWKYYDNAWASKSAAEIKADGFVNQPAVPRSASNLDMGFLNAASVYHTLAAKYYCYSMAAPSWNTADGGHSAFMNYLDNGAVTDFESIKNEIVYYLGAGSTVEDYMGYTDDYNFDLADPEKMTVVVEQPNGGTVPYDAVKIGDNKYGFGPQLSDGNYTYEVTYVPGDKKADEHIVWTINTNVSNFSRVNLRYKVKLTNPKTEPGTYGEYDPAGTKSKAGLYTNSRAVLHPVASNGTVGASEEFSKPTVSYTVTKSDTKPDDSKPGDTKQGDNTKPNKNDKGSNSNTNSGKTPNTGDESGMAAWMLILAASAAALGTAAVYRRKTKVNR